MYYSIAGRQHETVIFPKYVHITALILGIFYNSLSHLCPSTAILQNNNGLRRYHCVIIYPLLG